MSRFKPRSTSKNYGVKSDFNFLSFRGKIYAAAIVFLIGIFLEGTLVFTLCTTTHDEMQKSYQLWEQSRNKIHKLTALSASLLKRYQTSLAQGTLVATSDLQVKFSREMALVLRHMQDLHRDEKAYRASERLLIRDYHRLDRQMKRDKRSIISPLQYSRMKRLNHQYTLSLKRLEQRLNQSSRNFPAWGYQGWTFLLGLFILSLTATMSGALIFFAVKSIIKPAGLISESLNATKPKRLSVELPEMSQEGLGHFGHILHDSLRHWNTQFLDSKNSIRHFDQLCKESVIEIRKTELFAIQLQKVSEELNDNWNNENQLIESAHSQLSVITNNGEELQKIPQQLAVIYRGLKNQLTVVHDQVQTILSQNFEVDDESIEIADLAKNLDDASVKIKGVISILNDVSERTELLAFNTAIQAARAGDKGLGFGVVAKEIAKLVEYSQKASMQLSNMLNRINGKNEDILNLIHQPSETYSVSFMVCEEVEKSCEELFGIAQTNFANIEKLISVMETLLVQSKQLSGEIRQAIQLTGEDSFGDLDFNLETLDYQLNVKEANRIASRVSENSEQLRTLAETAISEEDFVS